MEKRTKAQNAELRTALTDLYTTYNRREYVSPDPLQFLYDYDDVRDREVAGLVASALAYGRVAQILKSAAKALERMGRSPRDYVESSTRGGLDRDFAGFKHRFTTGEELSAMLAGVKRVVKRHGSLEECFVSGFRKDDKNALSALNIFVEELNIGNPKRGHLMPSPAKGSACKRLNLYLRWMVRSDEVDPGGWDGVPASQLIVPLDTHMHRCALALGLTRRRQADLGTAVEITDAFRQICPEDPVKFDFSLTRLGIRTELDFSGFLSKCGVKKVA